MSLVRFKAKNHPQQQALMGPIEEIDDRGTTLEMFSELHARFRFTVDVAAAAHNTKCARYFDREADGLAQPWTGERVWCNPPYSDIRPWAIKAWTEACPIVVMLLPANRTEQSWWQELVEPYRDRPGSGLTVEFLPGRIRFIKAGSTSVGPNERPPFGVCLLIWQRTSGGDP